MAKYDPLTLVLRDAAARGAACVEMSFDEIGALVGGLPESATLRQWWANNSQVQSLAWRAADFHVDAVALDRRRVRFARGRVGGTYADRGRRPRATPLPAAESTESSDRPVDVGVTMTWLDGGPVSLDAAGRVAFAAAPAGAAVYRIVLEPRDSGGRPGVYIGETTSLRRRTSTNYRNPGLRQQTSHRINALLRDHLAAGGTARLAYAVSAVVRMAGSAERTVTFGRLEERRLAENAAILAARAEGGADIHNLDRYAPDGD